MSANGNADARAAGLRYSSDDEPGISRRKAGRGFSYRTERGGVDWQRPPARSHPRARDTAGVDDVWICADARGHLQATGRDARGRKQYLYHADWRALRDATKFDRMVDFGTTLPRTARPDRRRPRAARPAARARARGGRPSRRRDADPRRQRGVPARRTAPSARRRCARGTREWRAGTSRWSSRASPASCSRPSSPTAAWRARSRSCTTFPGRELFEYLDDGERRPARALRRRQRYLREISGAEITVKDFRTWGASALCMRALDDLDPPASATAAKRAIAEAIRDVADGARQHAGGLPRVLRASRHPRELRGREAPARAAAACAASTLGVGSAQVPARAAS